MEAPDLSALLDHDDGQRAASPSLEDVVRRYRRRRARRARLAAGAGVLTVCAGVGIGVAASNQSPPTTVAAGGAQPADSGLRGGPSPSAGQGPASTVHGAATAGPIAPAGLTWISGTSGAAVAGDVPVSPSGPGNRGAMPVASQITDAGPLYGAVQPAAAAGPSMHLVFTRQVGDVAVRAYLATYAAAPLVVSPPTQAEPVAASRDATQPSGTSPPVTASAGTSATAPAVPAECALTSYLVVEVSDPAIAAEVAVPLGAPSGHLLDVVAEQVVGTAEGSPVAVVVAHGGSSLERATAAFGAGRSDSMRPTDGWVVLVAPLGGARSEASSATPAVLTADGGGSTEVAHLPGSGALALRPEGCPVTGSGGSAGGGSSRGGSSTGSIGGGSTGTGASGAGTTSSGTTRSGTTAVGGLSVSRPPSG